MKRVLIVSPHFPPVNAPDQQRVRMSLPYFRENGWEPTVLAIAASAVEGTKDPLLMETIPPDVTVHRVGALPVGLTRLVGLGNIGYRAWFQLRAEGNRLLRGGKFDLVYFSTTQFVVTALGAKWQRRFGTPYVIDLQDPWRTDYYDRAGAPRPPGGWKYRFARWQAERMEEPAWRDAAGFVSVNENYLEQLRARYPWFQAKPAAVVPFGASESDYTLARTRDDLPVAFVRESGAVHLVAVGAVGPIMRQALEHLFAVVRRFRATEPSLAARLRFHFIGTSYAAGGRGRESVMPVAAEFGVSDLVREQTGRVGFFVAIKTMLAADAIVIPGSDDPAYNPSKIATCYLAHKPTLAVAPAGSTLERMVNELSFAAIAHPANATGSTVEKFLREILSGSGAAFQMDRATVRFETTHAARARTRQQCELFARALPQLAEGRNS
jgi:hypothetical protein